MKIAIATQNDLVSEHFGHCEGFTIYDVENEAVTEKQYIANPGHQPGSLPVFLKEAKVQMIIAGGMGERAQNLFAKQDIDVIIGADGNCDDVIEEYNKGNLKSNSVICTEHLNSGDFGGH